MSDATTTRLEPLLDAADDWRVLAAADGLRPAFDDDTPLDGSCVRFAPTAATYRASAYGDGTEVLLFGNAPSGASVAAVVRGFYPYLFVRLEGDELRDVDAVRALVDELDASLAAVTALDASRAWSPEFKALRSALAGSVRARRDKTRWLLFAADADASAERVRRAHPIVGYEVLDASMLCGTGAERGYRGIEPRRFLKLYFYSPTYVAKCRALLHGRHAERGWRAQLEALARTGARPADGGAPAHDASAGRAANQSTLDCLWLPHGDVDGDADDGDAETKTRTAYEALEAAEDALVFDDEPDTLADALADLGLDGDADAADEPRSGVLADAPHTADGRAALEARANKLLLAGALRRAEATRRAGRLSALREWAPRVVCEADIDFVLRFAMNCGFRFEQFVEIDTAEELRADECCERRALEPHSFRDGADEWCAPRAPPGIAPSRTAVRRATGGARRTRAQLELHCDFHHVRLCDDAALQNTLPPRVVAAVDAEMELGPDNKFPDPTAQRVLQICCALPLPHDRQRRRVVAFLLEQAESGPGRWRDATEHTPGAERRRPHVELERDDDAFTGAEFYEPGAAVGRSGDPLPRWTEPRRLGVVGSRGFGGARMLADVVGAVGALACLVTGDAPRGADALARDYAAERGVECAVHTAEWAAHGKSAGPRRNAALVADCDHVLAFWDGTSPGTRNAIQAARSAGVRCTVFDYVRSAAAQARKRKRAAEAQRGGARWQVFERALDDGVESEHVLCFRDERTLLLAFATFVARLDADKWTSYNGDTFDLPYFLERARQLDIEAAFAGVWGKTRGYGARLRVRDRVFETKAHGRHEYRDVSADGVLFFDLYQYLKRNPMIKLRNYSLNTAAAAFVGMQKEDVAYSEINTLQTTPAGRRRMMVYCVRDAELPDRIDQAKTIELEMVEKCRATGVTLLMLLKRGMQIQVRRPPAVCSPAALTRARAVQVVPVPQGHGGRAHPRGGARHRGRRRPAAARALLHAHRVRAAAAGVERQVRRRHGARAGARPARRARLDARLHVALPDDHEERQLLPPDAARARL